MKSRVILTLILSLIVVTVKSETVEIVTTEGTIVAQLDAKAAPKTVSNFMSYARAGFYEGTIFHRVIPGFMIQGGGFDHEHYKKDTCDPIPLEAGNGLSNKRGTVAMARTNLRDSATAQFFINLTDNDYLDTSGGGYAVFGNVVDGMDIVDLIANTQTHDLGPHKNIPVKNIIIKEVKVRSDPSDSSQPIKLACLGGQKEPTASREKLGEKWVPPTAKKTKTLEQEACEGQVVAAVKAPSEDEIASAYICELLEYNFARNGKNTVIVKGTNANVKVTDVRVDRCVAEGRGFRCEYAFSTEILLDSATQLFASLFNLPGSVKKTYSKSDLFTKTSNGWRSPSIKNRIIERRKRANKERYEEGEKRWQETQQRWQEESLDLFF
jgi:peptidyl-prolyl cis-trans isomerase A (cyclophilin A)